MLEEVKSALDFLIERFKMERYIYLSVTVGAFLLLLVCAIIAYSEKRDFTIITGMLGATGVMGYCCSQILKMWTDCLSIISQAMSHGQRKTRG